MTAACHLRVSDLRGMAQLATQATRSIATITEGVHRSVMDTMGIPGGKARGQTRGITGLVYRSIHTISQLAGKTVDMTLAGLQTLFESTDAAQPETPQRVALLAALNGVMGDYLAASNNPLAISMTLRYRDRPLNWQDPSQMPKASAKILLLIHGLCMSDLKRQALHSGQAGDHGAALEAALGHSPVYLHYNSGLHISQNGRELSARLEQLFNHWPTPAEELTVVAHSMGGLLIRSAFYYGQQQGLRWPDRLKNIIFLGTPHHGAALERAGNWVDSIVASTPVTRPFNTLGQVRSAGITDLRYGYLLDEEWLGQNRFYPKPDERRPVPLPESVACYAIAANLSDQRNHLSNRVVGDGLVPLDSALGYHQDSRRRLAFAPASQWIARRMSHLELLSKPEVTRQMVQWLTRTAIEQSDR